jgi:hypothetical protein
VEVLVRPRRFFHAAVAPGDQAPGLTFAMAVVLVEEASRLALAPAAVPALTGSRAASAVITVAVAVLIVTPAALHLVAAVQTVPLMALAGDRAGISETVQVLAYAAAPCALAGVPVPAVRVAATAYGAVLLVVGLAVVHRMGRRRAILAGAIPAALVFGYGFRGFAAIATLLAEWYII